MSLLLHRNRGQIDNPQNLGGVMAAGTGRNQLVVDVGTGHELLECGGGFITSKSLELWFAQQWVPIMGGHIQQCSVAFMAYPWR
jgi:hypothetical protein